MRILLVEANLGHTKALRAFLKAEGLVVEPTDNGADALDLLRHYEFDLVLVNLVLPDMDGITLISRMRAAGRNTPVLALASTPSARSRLKALSVGADDVVEQDVDRAEMVARMRAIVRRTRGYSHSLLRVGALTLDVEQQEAIADGSRISLSGKEFAILQLLMLRKNMILTKDVILSNLYGGMDEPDIKIIDVFICKIRSKLAKAGVHDAIRTVWGRGYMVRDTRRDDEGPLMPAIPQPSEQDRLTAEYA
jgi:two-component system, cell cycle response regulator CtrA